MYLALFLFLSDMNLKGDNDMTFKVRATSYLKDEDVIKGILNYMILALRLKKNGCPNSKRYVMRMGSYFNNFPAIK